VRIESELVVMARPVESLTADAPVPNCDHGAKWRYRRLMPGPAGGKGHGCPGHLTGVGVVLFDLDDGREDRAESVQSRYNPLVGLHAELMVISVTPSGRSPVYRGHRRATGGSTARLPGRMSG
jgi:hypothetical protein